MHSFCRCGWVLVRGFLCPFWCETHTKGLRARFPTRPEDEEERQGPRAVNSRNELEQSGKGYNQRKAAAKWGVRTWGPRGRVSIPGSCVGIFKYMLVTDTEAKNAKDVPKTPPFLCLGLTQIRACLFFFLPLLVVYVVSCVFEKQCEMPWLKMRETTRQSDGHELV